LKKRYLGEKDMELVYAWIEKFRNLNEFEVNFSEKFIIKYDNSIRSIKVIPNTSYLSIYPEYISNINAVVGRNGVGKTNLLDVLGLRTNDRNKNNAEYEIIYKKKKKFGYRIPDDIETEIKHSIYFFIYYLGKDENNQDLFCFEGNDIESFQKIIKFESSLSIEYWKSKYWFAFICNYLDGMLIHKYDLNAKIGEYKTESHKGGIRYIGDYRNEQDKISIISLRENLSNKHYDHNSTKPEDDYKISVPRRIAKFQSKLLAMKVEMLYKQLQKPKRLMFKDSKYKLLLSYNSYSLTSGFDDENKLVMKYSYTDLDGREKDVCKVLESFVQYYYRSITNIVSNEKKKNIEGQTSEIDIKSKSFNGYKDYYFEIVKQISKGYFIDNGDIQHLLNSYTSFAKELSKNKNLKFYNDYIIFDITKSVPIREILRFINISVDERVMSTFNEKISVFDDFFDYTLENLSDGENAYLGFFASLYEQVSLLTPNKDKYIILLDEPEARMHPELTRNFINELILFLGDLCERKKRFQVIISTHSPFILSDIPSNNITYLEKDSTGYCKPVNRVLSTFGSNIHTLLKDGFFMSSTIGEFATIKIREVISLIDYSNVEDVSENQKKQWIYIINSIGEPLIRNRIMNMFNEKFQLNYTDLYNENFILKDKLKKYEEPTKISETIEILRKQIEKLQIHVNELEDMHNDQDKN
jgi:predicted ATPase